MHQEMSTLKRRRNAASARPALRVRSALPGDLAQVIAIDTRATGLPKPEYHFVGSDTQIVWTPVTPYVIYQDSTSHELLAAITADFRRLGVATVRTLIARDNQLVLSFFRSQGMMAAPVIPLEKDIG